MTKGNEMTTQTAITTSIDARGMPCPGPLMSLIGAIREGTVGDVIEVLSSDEGSKSDIPAWVAKAGHELIEVVTEQDHARFVIKKVR
jgi:tRNA 2-thiouridine synthesizing protein A